MMMRSTVRGALNIVPLLLLEGKKKSVPFPSLLRREHRSKEGRGQRWRGTAVVAMVWRDGAGEGRMGGDGGEIWGSF
jgi:hypothetical protein